MKQYLTEEQLDRVVNAMVDFRHDRMSRIKEIRYSNKNPYSIRIDDEHVPCSNVRKLRNVLSACLVRFEDIDLTDDHFLFLNMLGEVVLCLDTAPGAFANKGGQR